MLDTLSRQGPFFPVGDRLVPSAVPLREYEDITDFDKQICAAGVKDFIRPAVLDDLHLGDAPYVRVTEISPGFRHRSLMSPLLPADHLWN